MESYYVSVEFHCSHLEHFLLQFLSILLSRSNNNKCNQKFRITKLEALTQFLAGIGIVIGAIILAVGIGVLSKKCAARYSLFALFLLEISTI